MQSFTQYPLIKVTWNRKKVAIADILVTFIFVMILLNQKWNYKISYFILYQLFSVVKFESKWNAFYTAQSLFKKKNNFKTLQNYLKHPQITEKKEHPLPNRSEWIRTSKAKFSIIFLTFQWQTKVNKTLISKKYEANLSLRTIRAKRYEWLLQKRLNTKILKRKYLNSKIMLVLGFFFLPNNKNKKSIYLNFHSKLT